LQYQKRVLKKLEKLRFNWGLDLDSVLYGEMWLEYEDDNGYGMCSPDIVLDLEDRILVLECKLTQTETARLQIFQLYAPVLSRCWNKPIVGVGVFRNLISKAENPVLNIEHLCKAPLEELDTYYTLHWTI